MPDSDPSSEKQTNIRRWISSINQTKRMFGHHREDDHTPEEPAKQIEDGVTDTELEDELDELERELAAEQ